MLAKSKAGHRLPDSVFSPQDVSALILEVRDYARWASSASIKKRVSQKRPVEPPALSPATAEVIDGWAAGAKQALSPQSLDQLIKSLEAFRKTAPRLTITLAAPPTREIKQTLTAWCRDNIAPDALVTFQFNSTLLGGMVVRYGSHIFDWSFRRRILEARTNFPEVLRRV